MLMMDQSGNQFMLSAVHLTFPSVSHPNSDMLGVSNQAMCDDCHIVCNFSTDWYGGRRDRSVAFFSIDTFLVSIFFVSSTLLW